MHLISLLRLALNDRNNLTKTTNNGRTCRAPQARIHMLSEHDTTPCYTHMTLFVHRLPREASMCEVRTVNSTVGSI